jgi:hypothetical protein
MTVNITGMAAQAQAMVIKNVRVGLPSSNFFFKYISRGVTNMWLIFMHK